MMNVYEMKVFFDNGSTYIQMVDEDTKNHFNARQMTGIKFQSLHNSYRGVLFDIEKVTHITFLLVEPDEEQEEKEGEA